MKNLRLLRSLERRFQYTNQPSNILRSHRRMLPSVPLSRFTASARRWLRSWTTDELSWWGAQMVPIRSAPPHSSGWNARCASVKNRTDQPDRRWLINGQVFHIGGNKPGFCKSTSFPFWGSVTLNLCRNANRTISEYAVRASASAVGILKEATVNPNLLRTNAAAAPGCCRSAGSPRLEQNSVKSRSLKSPKSRPSPNTTTST